MAEGWDPFWRRQLLEAFAVANERLEALLWAESRGNPVDYGELDALQGEISGLWDAYVAAVPRLPVARCPFSGEVAYHSCDNAALDGLWWRHDSPLRPEERLPPTFLALTGAVAITPPVEDTSFLCKPGPGVPYVLPQLLTRRPVKGVLHAFPVGRHTAYAITYFCELPGLPLVRPNTWGTGAYTWTDAAGRRRWGEADEEDEVWEFDLRPWLDRGQLLWIAPGDAGLVLRAGSAGCPYLALAGERRAQYVQFGEITTW